MLWDISGFEENSGRFQMLRNKDKELNFVRQASLFETKIQITFIMSLAKKTAVEGREQKITERQQFGAFIQRYVCFLTSVLFDNWNYQRTHRFDSPR